jgi:predicted nucleotidyltransferase
MDSVTLDKARSAAAELLPAFEMLAAYAYGSRVTGDHRPDSDLDVGYYVRGYRDGDCLSVRDEMILADRLSVLIGVDVDLRDMGRAPLEVRGALAEDGVRIFEGDFLARVELEADTLSRYHDYKAEFDELRRLRVRRLVDLARK